MASSIIGAKARKAAPGTARSATRGSSPARKGPAKGAAPSAARPAARSVPAPAPAAPTAPEPLPAQVRLLTVDDGSAGQRLDNFLIRELKGAPKTLVYRIIRSGEVRINKGRCAADSRLAVGDVVRVPPVRLAEKPAEPAIPAREFPVVFEDEHLIVVDKPAGVAVHGGSGVSFGVIEQLRRARPQAKFLELVHRLDKETSGLLMIAKKRSALTHLQDQLRDRETGKTYAALVSGAWARSKKVVDVPLLKFVGSDGERWVRAVPNPGDPQADQAKRSISLVKVMEAFAGRAPDDAGYSLLDVTIKTGRTHQIRVHLAHEGHPIVGDPKYGDFEANRALARGALRFDRMFLHARQLRVIHPATGETLTLNAPLPPECETLLAALRRPAP